MFDICRMYGMSEAAHGATRDRCAKLGASQLRHLEDDVTELIRPERMHSYPALKHDALDRHVLPPERRARRSGSCEP